MKKIKVSMESFRYSSIIVTPQIACDNDLLCLISLVRNTGTQEENHSFRRGSRHLIWREIEVYGG